MSQLSSEAGATKLADRSQAADSAPVTNITVALLTGGVDPPYVYGISMALISKGISLEILGSDKVDRPEMHSTRGITFLNIQKSQPENASFGRRARSILSIYGRILRYAWTAEPKIFHILWNNKVEWFDRIVLTVYFKLLGKKVAFTAHNVNTRARDGKDSAFNRLSLRVQYRLVDRIFVHTERMKKELLTDFGVKERAISVIPFGVNNAVPDSKLTPSEARQRLGIGQGEKAILFFGALRPSKGLEYLVAAFQLLARNHREYRLIVAGERKKGSEQYVDGIRATISQDVSSDRVIQVIEYIPDADTEVYFKAADVVVLPYTAIFQSGVLFLSYSFGLPVIATNVGSFEDDVIVGQTGFLCDPCDSAALAGVIERYFDSGLFKSLDASRRLIRDHVRARHSWDLVGEKIQNVYDEFLKA
jgi:glycosyltransferase involved in cell wall biosynthesis